MTSTSEASVPSNSLPDGPGSLFAALQAGALRDPEQLREIYEQPGDRARRKEVDRLHEVARRLIACASMVFVASSDAAGRCDVSPRGGPAGLVSVLDEYTLAIPDATGNKRLDTLHNILENGQVGLLFVVPGRDTTLRVNGRACVSTDPELLRQLTAVGKPPRSAIVVAVDEVYAHCPKAFLRGSAWKPENWLAKDAQPSSAEVTLSHLRDDALTIEMIEQDERDALLYRYE
ncbi:MSMEG_1061 family FMN-dependent PPOX-type flavoprotein [Kitasatospora aureofaciens]|uniref:MSMEG_1061 family FMN-dependent PPOX-type flavoprotein n=1 Tax=Kitasatospora aureofaciens TaxID=1894 RepID=UPI001C4787EB|nr:MSMEG_1061 family FMN-dependent PPOX-type flavoprotein [Kitasatospora aureofaciens]MBV6698176.1 pyridoxamine 5'-phosphate oxidase family protein [Kitasatospora aureofaciens]